jgi:hypothetical protein
VIEQLLGDDRLSHISRASGADLVLAALVGASSETGTSLWQRAGVLVDLFLNVESDETAERIAECASEEANFDWYFLFRLGDITAVKSEFSIYKVLMKLTETERGRLALRVLARKTMNSVRGRWIDKQTEIVLIRTIEYADEQTTLDAVKSNNTRVSDAALRKKLDNTPVCEVADYLQEHGIAAGWAWREIAERALHEEFCEMIDSPTRTEETKLLLLRGRPIELRRPRN